MKLLVTGGAGYIGSFVPQQLLDGGQGVLGLDALSRGHRSAVPAGAPLIEANLLDDNATNEALGQGFDGVLHFAALALVAESVAHPERYYRGNVVGTLNLLDAMREHGVGRLVFSSTCAVYGEPDTVPMREDIPTAPVNAYGGSKLAVDRMIGDECRAHGLGATSLRYFNVAGASGGVGGDHYPQKHPNPPRPPAAAREPELRVEPQQQRAVRRQPARRERVQLPHGLDAEPAPAALVGERGVHEAVEQHPAAGVEQRPQQLLHELRACSCIDERLRARAD